MEEVVDDKEPRNQTTRLLKENKMGVYIELLETDVWIQKTNIAMELAIKENSKKWTNNWYQQNITNIWTYLAKKRHIVSPNQDLGTTRSK
jgi:hypothetical protein